MSSLHFGRKIQNNTQKQGKVAGKSGKIPKIKKKSLENPGKNNKIRKTTQNSEKDQKTPEKYW